MQVIRKIMAIPFAIAIVLLTLTAVAIAGFAHILGLDTGFDLSAEDFDDI